MSDYGRAEQGSDEEFIPKEMLGELSVANPEVKLSERLSNLGESIQRLREIIKMLFDRVGPVMRPEIEQEGNGGMKDPSPPLPMSEVAGLIDDYRSQIQSLERMVYRNLNRIEL